MAERDNVLVQNGQRHENMGRQEFKFSDSRREITPLHATQTLRSPNPRGPSADSSISANRTWHYSSPISNLRSDPGYQTCKSLDALRCLNFQIGRVIKDRGMRPARGWIEFAICGFLHAPSGAPCATDVTTGLPLPFLSVFGGGGFTKLFPSFVPLACFWIIWIPIEFRECFGLSPKRRLRVMYFEFKCMLWISALRSMDLCRTSRVMDGERLHRF